MKNQNNKMKVLDLCNLNGEQTKRLNAIAEKSRSKYALLVDRVSENNINVSEWWYTAFVSRENSQSNGFIDFCLLQYALEEIEKGHYDIVCVPRRSIKKAIIRNTNQRVKFRVKEGKKEIIKRIFSNIYCVRNVLLTKKRIKIVKKNTHLSKISILDGSIVLVDTYCIPSQFNRGVYKDRYFTGLKENAQNKKVVFLGQLDFVKMADGAKLADNLNGLDDMVPFEVLVKESDYKKINRFIKRKYYIGNTTIEGIDYKDIVEDAVYSGNSNITSMYGILKGEVIKRILRREGTQVTHLLGWYEGQASSNGMFLSAREVDDKVCTMAYISVPCAENNIGLYPSRLQNREKKVAEYYAVGGEAWINRVMQFDVNTKCKLAPAFRHGDIERVYKVDKRDGVIIIASGVCSVAKAQIEISLEALNQVGCKHVTIKNHPFYMNYTIEDYGICQTVKGNIKIDYANGDLKEEIIKKKIAIISESSSSLEILLQGLKVINYIPNGKLSFLCIPDEYVSFISVVYSKEELIETLSTHSNLNMMELIDIRKKTFEMVSEKAVKYMFGVKNE